MCFPFIQYVKSLRVSMMYITEDHGEIFGCRVRKGSPRSLTYNSVYQQSQDSVVVQFASFWSLLTPRQSSEIPAASTRSPQCFSYPVAETRSSGSKLSTLAVANFLSKSSTLALPCSRQRRVCLYLLSFCTGAASLVVNVFWCAQHK